MAGGLCRARWRAAKHARLGGLRKGRFGVLFQSVAAVTIRECYVFFGGLGCRLRAHLEYGQPQKSCRYKLNLRESAMLR